MRFLVVDSETAGQRRARAEAAGQSSAQSYVATLRCVEPGAVCAIVRARETGSDSRPPQLLRSYDGVFFSGSPLRVYQDTPQVRRQVEFMREVFAAGRHSFGSCAGLQIAVAAAGGEVAKAPRYGIGFGRRIGASAAGRAHALLAGRPAAWDAPTIHSDVVERLPPGGILLAGIAVCPVQAAEIRFGDGVFWGVQYHPELDLAEIAAGMRRQVDGILEQGFARTAAAAERQLELVEALGDRTGSARPGMAAGRRWRDHHSRATPARTGELHRHVASAGLIIVGGQPPLRDPCGMSVLNGLVLPPS